MYLKWTSLTMTMGCWQGLRIKRLLKYGLHTERISLWAGKLCSPHEMVTSINCSWWHKSSASSKKLLWWSSHLQKILLLFINVANKSSVSLYLSIRSSVSSDSVGAGVSDCIEGGAMELLWEQGRALWDGTWASSLDIFVFTLRLKQLCKKIEAALFLPQWSSR